MIVVLPFCSKDSEQALRLLEWISQLGTVQDHACLLIVDAGVSWNVALDALTLANKSFRSATIITNQEPVEGWIAGSASLFYTAAEHIEKEHMGPWLWIEPDSCPLKHRWLDQIALNYAGCGKPFMGHVYKCDQPSMPKENLSGIAVYPEDAFSRLKNWQDSPLAFDVACAYVTVPNAAHTDLIQHHWGEDGTPPTFGGTSPPEIPPSAVLFHRCKDTSLIRLLKKKLFPFTPDDEVAPCFVQLGRVGDLILLLPAFQEWADRMGQPTLVVVAREFASVLQGCSYVNPIIVNMHWHNQLGECINFARSRYPNVIVTQLHGAGHSEQPDDLESFSLSMWQRTGLLEMYHELLPVFDIRHRKYEQMLVDQYSKPGRPMLLTNFNSYTSPLGCQSEVERIISAFGHRFNIVNTSFIKARRPFDLLGLMEAAAGMITIDTMTLHLASACKVPYVAFVRNDGQSGSIPKGNCELKIGYNGAEKHLGKLAETLERWAK